MFYSKETLFAEFDVAKQKDIKLSKKKTYSEKDNDKHDNRIQFCKDHVELKAKHPEYYEGVDVNFGNLLLAYQSPNPRDYFYKSVFGKTYLEKMAESEFDKSQKESVN